MNEGQTTEPTPPRARITCSFCGKSDEQVARLVAGPTVYICDECIDLCNEILAQEIERDSPAGRPQSQVSAIGVEHRCALCNLPKPTDELVAVPDRGFICPVCVEAVRVAALPPEERCLVRLHEYRDHEQPSGRSPTRIGRTSSEHS